MTDPAHDLRTVLASLAPYAGSDPAHTMVDLVRCIGHLCDVDLDATHAMPMLDVEAALKLWRRTSIALQQDLCARVDLAAQSHDGVGVECARDRIAVVEDCARRLGPRWQVLLLRAPHVGGAR